jgi:hypothetical protein
MAIAVLLMVF